MPSNRPFLSHLNLLLRLRPCLPGSSVPIIGWLDDDGISNRFRVWDRGALERHVLPAWFPVRGETHEQPEDGEPSGMAERGEGSGGVNRFHIS